MLNMQQGNLTAHAQAQSIFLPAYPPTCTELVAELYSAVGSYIGFQP